MSAYMIDGNITKNFKLSEMCNTNTKSETKLTLTPKMVEHAQMMQELRDWYGKPLNVSSWYRTAQYNTFCGGDVNSAHLDGLATDITGIPEDMFDEFTTAWKTICSIHNKVGGVNYYSWGMHFCSNEDRFGHKDFQTRDKR